MDILNALFDALEARSNASRPHRALYHEIVRQPRIQRELAAVVGVTQPEVADIIKGLVKFGALVKGEGRMYFPGSNLEQQQAALEYALAWNAMYEAHERLKAFAAL